MSMAYVTFFDVEGPLKLSELSLRSSFRSASGTSAATMVR
jgi:hypothetical protein